MDDFWPSWAKIFEIYRVFKEFFHSKPNLIAYPDLKVSSNSQYMAKHSLHVPNRHSCAQLSPTSSPKMPKTSGLVIFDGLLDMQKSLPAPKFWIHDTPFSVTLCPFDLKIYSAIVEHEIKNVFVEKYFLLPPSFWTSPELLKISEKFQEPPKIESFRASARERSQNSKN